MMELASLSIPSWNQIAGFLDSMRQLRDGSGLAARRPRRQGRECLIHTPSLDWN